MNVNFIIIRVKRKWRSGVAEAVVIAISQVHIYKLIACIIHSFIYYVPYLPYLHVYVYILVAVK